MAAADNQATADFPAAVIARLLNITERRLQQLAKEGVVPRSGRGRYPLAGCVRGYIKYLQNSGGGTSDGAMDPGSLDPFRRRAHYQAEHEMLRIKERAGELVPHTRHREELAKLAKLFVTGVDTLPDVLERKASLTRKQVEVVQSHCDDLRERIYRANAADRPRL